MGGENKPSPFGPRGQEMLNKGWTPGDTSVPGERLGSTPASDLKTYGYQSPIDMVPSEDLEGNLETKRAMSGVFLGEKHGMNLGSELQPWIRNIIHNTNQKLTFKQRVKAIDDLDISGVEKLVAFDELARFYGNKEKYLLVYTPSTGRIDLREFGSKAEKAAYKQRIHTGRKTAYFSEKDRKIRKMLKKGKVTREHPVIRSMK